MQRSSGVKKKLTAIIAAALACMALISLCACAPDTSGSTEGTSTVASLPGTQVEADSGIFPEGYYTENFINEGNRGCNACHEDLYDAVLHSEEINPYPHLLNSAPTYGMKASITDCMTCHTMNFMFGGPVLTDIIHARHYSSDTFVNEQNGSCTSCHATNAAGEWVLWDYYKYTEDVSGYPAGGGAMAWIGDWRGFDTDTLNGITAKTNTELEAEFSVSYDQHISDSQDVFYVNNLYIPEVDINEWTLTVTGVKNPKSYTYEELKAMPQETVTTLHACTTNANDSWLAGNITATGPSVAYIIEDCGGLADSSYNYCNMIGLDGGWCYSNANVDDIYEKGAIVALELMGEEISPERGYPAVFVLPGLNAGFWAKFLSEMNFMEGPELDVTGATSTPESQQMCPTINTSVFTPSEDGQVFKVGETITFDGYAYSFSQNGVRLTDVEFSMDYGNTWYAAPVPEDFDCNQWYYYTVEWTPTEPGTYIFQSRAINNLGVEQFMPASVYVTVVE